MEPMHCNSRKKIIYIHSSIIIATAILAIVIGCHSMNIINDNNQDINKSGLQRANILKYEYLTSEILFATPAEQLELKKKCYH